MVLFTTQDNKTPCAIITILVVFFAIPSFLRMRREAREREALERRASSAIAEPSSASTASVTSTR